MMWHHKGELDAVNKGIIDKVLYTSEIQKQKLSPKYGNLPFTITGNYINAEFFPRLEREERNHIGIGRLSRPDPDKYPEN